MGDEGRTVEGERIGHRFAMPSPDPYRKQEG
jgi:hypothetical protein